VVALLYVCRYREHYHSSGYVWQGRKRVLAIQEVADDRISIHMTEVGRLPNNVADYGPQAGACDKLTESCGSNRLLPEQGNEMALTIYLSPEIEQQLRQRAAQIGRDVTTLAHDLLQRSLNKQPTLDEIAAQIPPGIRRSQEAYWRDLPQLLSLKSGKRQWVAYHGDERVGFGSTSAELFQECMESRGLKKEEFYVDRLEPRALPPWEAEAIDAPFPWSEATFTPSENRA
jgi:hypothetical protein